MLDAELALKGRYVHREVHHTRNDRSQRSVDVLSGSYALNPPPSLLTFHPSRCPPRNCAKVPTRTSTWTTTLRIFRAPESPSLRADST